ncbi:flagellar filament capping protein FliD [Vagococcus fluvialis]|uniref:flagellar filament capping protein FliD n=1 Tax=Vagococcus fluvialis TaxID=2738 RepID=UPI0014333C65|nr:flagellar filament capping protein FliD [Vagococcus fluvialis]MBO0485875.1 flagellar filament capping protein FliD [Vagococcus fluvialis]MDT2747364.1 flagellar filament capping protein FliD [Vagococcus fluvialis]NKC59591.1 flagellar filament capping protein FliD [Vagococcus fluvialis]NKD51787.1 flagellar filament capping protein FliD [Vagococcus fluvialis]UDM79773.1 flagellar filament capping protein FliD [Vagococcus fluvialis]
MASVGSTSGISSTLGTYSGITSKEIDKLIEAESVPLTKMNLRKSKMTEQQNAWKDVRLRLNSLFSNLEKLQKNETFNTKVTSSSHPEKVKITATDLADAENYQVTVERLATSSKLTSGEIKGLGDKSIYDQLEVSGTLEFQNKKGEKITVSIEEKDSLKEITNKINQESKETGIKAALINNRLVLTHTETGEKDFEVQGSLMEELGLNGASSKYVKGQNAKFTVDGMEVTRSSNEINDVIENVTIHLLGETKENVSLGLKTDTEKLTTAVKNFVEQYNNVMGFISEKTSVGDPSKKDNKTGSLTGDGSLMRLQSSLRFLMTGAPGTNDKTDIITPMEIGIESKDKTSTITFDEEKFKAALKKDPDAVKNFFYHESKELKEVTNPDGTTSSEFEKTEIGYTVKLKELMNEYLDDTKGKKGVFKSKAETLESNMKDIDERIERFNVKIEKKKDYYVRTFTKLDQVMMNAEAQMAYLQSQIDSFAAR